MGGRESQARGRAEALLGGVDVDPVATRERARHLAATRPPPDAPAIAGRAEGLALLYDGIRLLRGRLSTRFSYQGGRHAL